MTEQLVENSISKELTDSKESKESKEKLYTQIEKDVVQLKETMEILHDIVSEQQPELDSIEQHIHESKTHVAEAEIALTEATIYSQYTNYLWYVASGLGAIALYFL